MIVLGLKLRGVIRGNKSLEKLTATTMRAFRSALASAKASLRKNHVFHQQRTMGLLAFEGEPLEWEDIKPYVEHVKRHGIAQFINNYKRLLQRPDDVLKWGDEVEFMIVRFDDENKRVQLPLRAAELHEILQEQKPNKLNSSWNPEFASYMIEGIPGKPYRGILSQLNVVEANMRMRREEMQSYLKPDERIMSISVFPRLGCAGFTHPKYDIDGPDSNPITRSIFFPDEALSSHPRFIYMTKSIRQRRGEKIAINIPIFKDERTPSSFIEEFGDPEASAAAKPDHIYMDSTGFGFGNTCIQVTLQARNLEEAKLIYDQQAPLCPIMMALTAASPIFRGYLSDIDARWPVMSSSTDDRTSEERGLEPLKDCNRTISKSRYDSIDSYLSENSEMFNDIKLEIDEEAKETLMNAGIDEMLAQHIAHLWIRDPLMLFSGKIHQDDERETHHFENIQSTNWQSLRFKPPVPGSGIGWRVEFRVMESQLTDFENAAFVTFIVLLTRVIVAFKLDFRMPMSLVDENMARAHKNNAVKKERFYFRKNVITSGTPACCTQLCSDMDATQCNNNAERHHDQSSSSDDVSSLCQEMSLDTIINGKAGVFPGFIPLIRRYLDSVEIEVQARCSITEYLNLISKRASGDFMTAAQWMRHFVTSHPDYKRDSVVTDEMAYDLLRHIDRIEKGEVVCHQLFGTPRHKSEYVIDATS